MDIETGVDPTGVVSPATEEQITKIVASRISAEREKLAKAIGYDSWDHAMNSGIDKKLVDAGIDPELGKPIIDSAVNSHPEVIKARQVIAEATAAREAAEISALNAKYGLSLESVDKLDEPVKQLMQKGVSLSQAYVAVHIDELTTAKSVKISDPPKGTIQHITPLPGSTAPAPTVPGISDTDIAAAKRYMPGATDDQVKAFLAAHPELK